MNKCPLLLTLMLTITLGLQALSASETCVLRSRQLGSSVMFDERNFVCENNFDESELLDLDELTLVEAETEGIGKHGTKIYKDKSGTVWFIKDISFPYTSYIGGHILQLFLGNERIADVRFVKGHPSFVASKKLENFHTLHYLIGKKILTEDQKEIYSPFFENKTPNKIINNEDLVTGMNYIGIIGRHTSNQGCIVKAGGVLEAARIDYDETMWGSPYDFNNAVLFKQHVDFAKMEKAIIDLLNLPEDQINSILERAAHFSPLAGPDEISKTQQYLKIRKDNFKKLLPLITCLKKILNEGDLNYLEKNKKLLMSFKGSSTISGSDDISMIMYQLVEKGCVEALKKLKELECYPYDKNGYGLHGENLIQVAQRNNHQEVLDYLRNDKEMLGTLEEVTLEVMLSEALQSKNWSLAKTLIEAIDQYYYGNHLYYPYKVRSAFRDNNKDLIDLLTQFEAYVNYEAPYNAIKNKPLSWTDWLKNLLSGTDSQ